MSRGDIDQISYHARFAERRLFNDSVKDIFDDILVMHVKSAMCSGYVRQSMN